MATAIQVPPITIDQYLAFEGYPGLKDELINGRIVMSPQPKILHQHLIQNLLMLLRPQLETSDYALSMNSNIEFRLSNSMPAPDVFVVTKEAYRRALDGESYIDTPPLLVIEVISPANRKRNVEEKSLLYLSQGVPFVWNIYPKKQRLVQCALDQAGALLQQDVDRIEIQHPVRVVLNPEDVFRMI